MELMTCKWYLVKHSCVTKGVFSDYNGQRKQIKLWFDKECVDFLDQRKQAKIQWIQDPSRSNVDNLNNVRCNASRHFRNKKKAYLKAKIEELETNSKVNNVRDLYRGINPFSASPPHRTYARSARLILRKLLVLIQIVLLTTNIKRDF